MASTSKKEKKPQQMQVFVRVRPLNKQEGSNSVVEVVSNREVCVKTHGGYEKRFIYDRVFGPESQQLEVYKLVAEPAVKEVMSGYNCTVLAYGQTGTGKTYTMAGGKATDMGNITSTSWFEDVDSGIIPRTMAHMFDELRLHQLEFTVRVSYLELYNEEIFDLLSAIDDNTKLKLYDDSMKKGSVIVSGLTEVTVNNKSDVFQVLEKGSEKRKVASTLMNSQSSRSHTVFCITLHTKENAVGSEDVLKMGKLYLVDLAGSENIKQSGATELRAREAVSINQSLLSLGRCITKLIEHCGHIPYRESKLTRLLQDSLGGRTKATLIATVSPAACNTDETINTLQYAFLAKGITNKPEINQRLSKKTLLKEYTEEIERLRKDLAATRACKGVYLAEDNYEALLRSRDGFKDELTEKLGQIRGMQEQLKKNEDVFSELKMSFDVLEKDSEGKAVEIDSLNYKLQDQSKVITDLQLENELKQFLVEKFSRTEEQLKFTAKELLTVADTTTGDARKLHDKLDVLADLSKHNKQVCEQHINEFNAKIDGIGNKLRNFHDYEFKFHKYMVDMLNHLDNDYSIKEKQTQEMVSTLGALCATMRQQKNDADSSAQARRGGFTSAQQNTAQAIKTSQDTCLDKYDATVVQQVHNLYAHIQEQGQFLFETLNGWRQMVDANHAQVSEFVGSCKKLVLESKAEAQKHVEREMRLCAQIQNELRNQDKNNTVLESAFEAQYGSALRALNEMKTLMTEYSKSNKDQSQQRQGDLAGLHDDLQDLHSSYANTSDNTCQFIDSLHLGQQEDHAAIQVTKDQGSDINDRLENSMRTVNDLLDKHKDDAIASYKEIEKTCSNEFSTQRDLVGQEFAKHSSDLQEMKSQLAKVKDSLETNISELSLTMGNSTTAMSNSVEEHDMCCNEMDSIVGTELDNCREGFRRLYTSSLKEYKVTGETPQRKTYRYPRTLPETMPEKLVEQWKQERLQQMEESEELEDKENQVQVNENENSNGNGNENNLAKSNQQYHQPTTDPVIPDDNN